MLAEDGMLTSIHNDVNAHTALGLLNSVSGCELGRKGRFV